MGSYVRSQSAASPLATELLRAYVCEIATLLPDGFDAVHSAALDADEMAPPNGDFLVLFDDAGDAIGCGGLRLLDDGRMEIKRMFIEPKFRGAGFGRALLAALENRAKELGATEVLLDTNSVLTPAIAMYQRSGYVEIERYNDNPYASKWFKKSLA